MSSVQSSGPTTKQQRVYETLRERILTGAYGPGYRLVFDAAAVELGVSTVPVREAIRRLEAEGLVVYRPNVGAQVAPADPGSFEDELLGARRAGGLCDGGGGATPHGD
jgi:DNA-binding GntR family transcriptional regulator